MSKSAWFDRPLLGLPGIGPVTAERLAARGLVKIIDFLRYVPIDWQDRRKLTPIAALQEGEFALTSGVVTAARLLFFGRGGGRGRTLEVFLCDGEQKLRLVFFHARSAMKEKFVLGQHWTAWGRAHFREKKACWEMIFPECSPVGSTGGDVAGEIMVRYREISGVAAATWRKLSAAIHALVPDGAEDSLPTEVRSRLGLLSLHEAAQELHWPTAELSQADLRYLREQKSAAHRRFAIEEIFNFYLKLALVEQRGYAQRTQRWQVSSELAAEWRQQLPFALSPSQQAALDDIAQDFRSDRSMRRLVYGDVGSGKTAVGVLAARMAVAGGAQVAWMAPTEILAQQTWARMNDWGFGAHAALLTSSTTRTEREQMIAKLADARIALVVGTQALLAEEIRFSRLSLVIIDEQQRFGVAQRQKLIELAATNREKPFRQPPHILSMTATPIPRTLAQLLYGDLGVSRLDDLQPRRVETTCLTGARGRTQAIDLVMHQLDAPGGIFWVCPRIEESDEARSVQAVLQALRKKIGVNRVDALHGQMASAQQQDCLDRFRAGEFKVLVTTTVVETGVDIPDTTLLVVDDANSFGLAQLHQLRGRIGRSGQPARQLLLCSDEERAGRLSAYARCTDGFEVAEMDLRMRGPGIFRGTEQSGLAATFSIAAIDATVWEEIRTIAVEHARSGGQPKQHADDAFLTQNYLT